MNSIESDSEDITKNTVMKSNKETSNDTLKLKSGIYKIVNKLDGKYYVGSTKDFDTRWKEHIYDLDRNIHHNNHLQNAWNKYGKNNFEFIIVENVCDTTKLRVVEQTYLNIAKLNESHIYNINWTSSGGDHFLGKKHTAEARHKMSTANKGRIVSEKTKRIKKTQNTGNSNPNVDHSIYHWKNILTREIFTGTRYEFRKTHNVSKYSDRDIMDGSCYRTKSGWTLDTHQ